jgi:predicted  nucleic acid-binding Zn-ribbon protein
MLDADKLHLVWLTHILQLGTLTSESDLESDALVPSQEETTSYNKPDTRKSSDSISQQDTMGLEAYDRQNEALTRRLMEREKELKKLEEEQEDRITYISQQAQQLEKEIASRKKEIQDYKSREQQASLQIQEVGQTVHLPITTSRN